MALNLLSRRQRFNPGEALSPARQSEFDGGKSCLEALMNLRRQGPTFLSPFCVFRLTPTRACANNQHRFPNKQPAPK